MKKSTLEALYNLVNGTGSLTDELREDVIAEYERTTAKANANTVLYNTALEVLKSVDDWDEPMTTKELCAKYADELPDDFSASKMNYAMRTYGDWMAAFEKHDNGKNPYTYTQK